MAGSHDRDTWLWVGGALIAIGVTAAAIGGGFAAARDGYDIWTSEPFIVAYAAFSLALICLVGAIRDWRFPFSTRPDPRPRTSNRVETKRPAPMPEPEPAPAVTERATSGSGRTPEDLWALIAGLTALQAESVIKPFLGESMTVRGRVFAVSPWSGSHSILTIDFADLLLALVISVFTDHAWVKRLALLRKGDEITVRGQLTAIKPNA